MKALHYNGKHLECVNDYPDPYSETQVKVNLAGICGTDLEIFKGYMKYTGVPGHEFVGTVVRSDKQDIVGKRVVGEINAGCETCESCMRGMQRHCPNRTVLGILNRDGAFAESLSLPAQNLHVIPDSISDMEAVFVEPLAAAFEITAQVKIDKTWSVSVVGDGRLAQLICQVLRIYCDDVTCFGRHDGKLAMLKGFDITTRTAINTQDEHSFDLVVDATGSGSGLADTMSLVKPRGIAVLKSTVADQNANLATAIINEVTLIGSRCGLFKPAIEALVSGAVTIHHMTNMTFRLEEYKQAIKEAQGSSTLKVFFRP